MADIDAPYSERVVTLGADHSLVGILTTPGFDSALPTVVLLNMGIIHRVGHHRLYVKIARWLAGRGHNVLRFDFPGIGDSPQRNDVGEPLETNLQSLKEVLDWLDESQGAKSFILMGLCSGADQSIIGASRDKRVVGAVLLDPSIPRTRRYFAIDFMRRFSRPDPWVNLLIGRGRTWAWLLRVLGVQPSGETAHVRFSQPHLNEPKIIDLLEKAYQGAIDNGARLLAVFTSGHDFQHNYRTQILDALPNVSFQDALDLHYFARCDHTFSAMAMQKRLFDVLEDWFDSRHFEARAKGAGDTPGTPQTSSTGPQPLKRLSRAFAG